MRRLATMWAAVATACAAAIGAGEARAIDPDPPGGALAGNKPRVIVSTDIGGSDPDDFQSMVHYLVYADMFDTEGLIASPPGTNGTKEDILEVIDAYEDDYTKLSSWSNSYPAPNALRAVTVDGALEKAPSAGYSTPTDGSELIIEAAQKSDDRPLFILVWGSITDVAQALHDEPSIASKLRVYSIGAWNRDEDPAARNYIYDNFPNLWWIETNSTFRGMYIGGTQTGDLGNWTFPDTHVDDHGQLGELFMAKKPDIKMGDTPSVLYMLTGDPLQPGTAHWGGKFIRPSPSTRPNFWTDDPAPSLNAGGYPGAVTVNIWRENYLRHWQARMDRAQSMNPGQPSGLISGLTVNHYSGSSWSIQSNLQVGNTQYGDRSFTFTSVPSALAGSTWIRTANDSKYYTGTTLAQFTVNNAAEVYVAYNMAIGSTPSWLSGWTNTGMTLVNSETPNPRTFAVYKKNFASGATVTLGSNNNTSHSMYTVIVRNAAPPTNLITGLSVNHYSSGDWSIRTNLQSGDQQYGDRSYAFTSVPALLAGQQWIRTANDSKYFTGTTLAQFTVTSSADVYVAYNQAIGSTPSWLSGWTNTGMTMTNNETPNPRTFVVYKKSYSGGSTVSLGSNNNVNHSMYTVIVRQP